MSVVPSSFAAGFAGAIAARPAAPEAERTLEAAKAVEREHLGESVRPDRRGVGPVALGERSHGVDRHRALQVAVQLDLGETSQPVAILGRQRHGRQRHGRKTHAGGAGRAIAEWMTDGAPGMDLREADITRFQPHQLTRPYIAERCAQNYREVYDIIHPLQPITKPRNVRLSPFQD